MAESVEAVAYQLLMGIAHDEGKIRGGIAVADKTWLLDTYTECLRAVKGKVSLTGSRADD
jgi:hypothetical protein